MTISAAAVPAGAGYPLGLRAIARALRGPPLQYESP
jgi:hypothetical protein